MNEKPSHWVGTGFKINAPVTLKAKPTKIPKREVLSPFETRLATNKVNNTTIAPMSAYANSQPGKDSCSAMNSSKPKNKNVKPKTVQ